METNREINALMHLIDDPDEEVFSTVSDRIISLGSEIIPNLENLWENTPDGGIQERIESLIHRLHFQDLQQEFTSWDRGERPDLLEGALLVADNTQINANPSGKVIGTVIEAELEDEDGKAEYRNRFVRTEGWQAEEQAGKFLYRGVFGTQKPGGAAANAFDLRLKNIANTHVVRLGDQLLALWEAAEPYALDPDTLETRGLTLLDGVLKKGEAFSAHPRFDPGHNGRPAMVSASSGVRPRVAVGEVAAGRPVRRRARAGDAGLGGGAGVAAGAAPEASRQELRLRQGARRAA